MNTNKLIEKIKHDEIINFIIAQAQKSSQKAEIYLVGGAIRDFCLDKENFDKDIIFDKADAEVFAKSLAKELDASFIFLDEENKIYRIVLKDKVNIIDIASPIGKNIEDDLKRRDLTINSIAVNLNTDEIIDINGGISDLENKKIRHISEQNFIDDPLRLLRAYRFESMLGFELDENLEKIIKKHVSKINKPAVERINYEILKLFSGNFTAKTLANMDKIGLLEELFPIMKEVKKVPSNLHHHLDLFNHSIETVKQVQNIYEKSPAVIKEHLQKIDFGAATRLAHLKLGAFLHDIGKPGTWTIEEDTGKHRFIKHDDVGSKIGSKLLKSSKFSKKQIDYIAKMIKYHIYPSHVVSCGEISDKVYMRFIRKMESEVIDVIILAMADRLSARGPEITDEIVKRNINNLQSLLDFYINVKDSIKPLPKLLSGEEIMEILNIKPSKELGNIIKEIQELQISGDITTREEALSYIEQYKIKI